MFLMRYQSAYLVRSRLAAHSCPCTSIFLFCGESDVRLGFVHQIVWPSFSDLSKYVETMLKSRYVIALFRTQRGNGRDGQRCLFSSSSCSLHTFLEEQVFVSVCERMYLCFYVLRAKLGDTRASPDTRHIKIKACPQ